MSWIEQNGQRNSADLRNWRRVARLSGWHFAAASTALLVTTYGVAAEPAVSESAAADSKGSEPVEEVIVTASKRSELLSKTPVAVSALDTNQLKDSGVVTLKDLTSAVPDVQIHTIGVDSFVGITIRGISNLDYSGNADPAVSTYIDGMYIGLSQGFANELYDLERVEVLRGPQGTLYGRNATGGNVNVITADPKNAFAASADVSYGNYNDIQVHGMVNIPVNDELQVRAAFMTHRNDGYFDDLGTTARNYGMSDDFGARLTGLWKPNSSFKWRLSLDGFVSKGTPWASIETGADGKPVNGLPVYQQPVGPDPQPDNYIRNLAVRSRMDWNASDSISVAYIAGYQSLNAYYDWATTGQPGAPANTGWEQYVQYSSTFQSHELNISYDSKALKNVFGGSFFYQNSPPSVGAGIYNAIDYNYTTVPTAAAQDSTKRAWGIFDQATYSVTDRLRFTGGVRFSSERQFIGAGLASIGCITNGTSSLTLYQYRTLTTVPAGCFNSPPSASGSGSWSSVTWKAGLDFDVNERTLAYVSAATGFKSGGVQPSTPAPLPLTFDPEKVINYEFGVKTRLREDSLNLRAAVFYEDYTNLQVFQLVPTPATGGLTLVTLNAAKAGIYGMELESEWRLSAVDQIRGFANYLHATYTEFHNAYDGRTSSIIPSLDGNQLPNAPQESFRIQYTHDFALPSGATITPLAAVYWQSRSYLQAFNTPLYQVNAYSKTNMSLTYTDASAHWKYAAYVDNLENKAIRTSNWADAGGVYSDFAPPRTYGVRVSYQ